ncbi:ABC transporter substrate-binding protein [Butyrivibrio sp. AD3002]|uniref:ABC transporter substrate-binding protein n=1 Tax=Butyrivibrio sp. AD3002 TaxID=1280670 RepID=UPI0003B6E9A5|nr:extracellular solute-binding protein [Butyrivibrio sp. AD3002]
MTERDNKKIKYWLSLFILIIVIFLTTDWWRSIPFHQKNVLTVGVFSDSYWNQQNGNQHKFIDSVIEKYEEQNPNIKVVYEKGILKDDYSEWLAEQIIQGTAPDVFIVIPEDFNMLRDIGALKNLDRMIQKDEDFDAGAFYEAAYSAGEADGVRYSLPVECAPDLMFVNRTILQNEGIELPSSKWTWEDFYDICRKVTKDTDGNGTIDQVGVADYSWEEAFASNNVTLFNKEGTESNFTDEKVYNALMFLDQLDVLYSGSGSADISFEHGNVAFWPMNFSSYRTYLNNPVHASRYADFDWDYLTMPAGPDGHNASILDLISIAMYSGTPMQNEAWEFMKLLTCDEDIQAGIFEFSEGISVCRDVTEAELVKENEMLPGMDESPNIETLEYTMQNAIFTHRFSGFNEAVNAVDTGVSELLKSDANIRMEQVIQARSINNFLKTIHN